MYSEPPSDDGPPRRKAVLFCPECGHESPTDGDWRTGSPSSVVCPDCSTTVADRQTAAEDTPPVESPIVASTELFTGLWRRYTRQVAVWMK